ncbi:MAG: hypothetical protein ACLS95_02995 [Clostridia bacterium]|jgi:hypothetical protein
MEFQTPMYLACLTEAAKLLKEGEKIPNDLIERAIGKRPKCTADSPDTDTFVKSYCQMPAYLEAESAFIEAASNFSQPSM